MLNEIKTKRKKKTHHQAKKNKFKLADFNFQALTAKNHFSIPKDFKYSGIRRRQTIKCQNITL